MASSPGLPRYQSLSQRGRDLFTRAQEAAHMPSFHPQEILAKMPLSLGKRNKEVRMWTPEEDELLRAAIEKFGEDDWEAVAAEVPGRTRLQCVQRWKKTLRPGQIKGPWKPEEDELLLRVMSEENEGDWQAVARRVPGRNAKQCKERWMCNLNPAINHGPWSPEEDAALVELHSEFGGKWSILAKRLTGRTEHAIKTRFLSLQRRAAKMRNWTVDEDRIVLREFMLASLQNGVGPTMKVLPGRTKKQIQERWRHLRDTYVSVDELATSSSQGGVVLTEDHLRHLIPHPSLTRPTAMSSAASTVSSQSEGERTKTLARRQNSSSSGQPYRHVAKRLEKSASSSSHSQKAAATIGSELLNQAYNSGFQSMLIEPLGTMEGAAASMDDPFVTGLINAGLSASPSVYSSTSSNGLQARLSERGTSSSPGKVMHPYASSSSFMMFPPLSPVPPPPGGDPGTFARQDSFSQIAGELEQLSRRESGRAGPPDDMFRAFSGMAPELGTAQQSGSMTGSSVLSDGPLWPAMPAPLAVGSEFNGEVGDRQLGLRKFASSAAGLDVDTLEAMLNGPK